MTYSRRTRVLQYSSLVTDYLPSAKASHSVSCAVKDRYFVLQCPRDDEVSVPKFCQTLRDFIETEQGKDLDLFDDAKVLRIQGTHTDLSQLRFEVEQTQTIAGVGVSDEAATSPEVDNHPGAEGQASQNAFLIEHETITQKWTPRVKGGLVNMKSSDQALGLIGSLCDCRLDFIGPTDTEVFLRSHNQQAIDRAISKLNVIDGMTRDYLNVPFVSTVELLTSHSANKSELPCITHNIRYHIVCSKLNGKCNTDGRIGLHLSHTRRRAICNATNDLARKC